MKVIEIKRFKSNSNKKKVISQKIYKMLQTNTKLKRSLIKKSKMIKYYTELNGKVSIFLLKNGNDLK